MNKQGKHSQLVIKVPCIQMIKGDMVYPQIMGDDQDNDQMLGFWNISEKTLIATCQGEPVQTHLTVYLCMQGIQLIKGLVCVIWTSFDLIVLEA